MSKLEGLAKRCQEAFASAIVLQDRNELTLEVPASDCFAICQTLKEDKNFGFEQLMDLCGVDYLHYGIDEWATDEATSTGFDRAVEYLSDKEIQLKASARFAVAYQLLSISNNTRLRVKTFVPDESMIVDSVVPIWNCANWYEREAFDLYGILFKGHPDLRRLLTDYGFIGHPFRKDFPISGEVEVRYDAAVGRVIYEPVDIEPRILVPKVIRQEHQEEALMESTDA